MKGARAYGDTTVRDSLITAQRRRALHMCNYRRHTCTCIYVALARTTTEYRGQGGCRRVVLGRIRRRNYGA